MMMQTNQTYPLKSGDLVSSGTRFEDTSGQHPLVFLLVSTDVCHTRIFILYAPRCFGGSMSLLDYWETQRPSMKRRKVADSDTEKASSSRKEDEGNLRENHGDTSTSPLIRALNSAAQDGIPVDNGTQIPGSQTELESSLPVIETDNQAIDDYESSRAVKEDDEPDLQQRLQDGKWRKGKSSIYVDAFNLALQTVLDEEAQLFNDVEMEVFRQWKELSYESQYLYVKAPLVFWF